jgi:HEAT repeat protein
MTDPDQFVRAQAALGLGLEGEESLVTPLINMMLSDSSEVARAAAAKSLGAFATLGEFEELSADSTDKIYSALESIILNPSESVDVRNKALVAISVLSKPKIPGLIEDAYYSGDIMSKVSAIYAMGSTCNHRWLDILLSEFSNENTEVRLASVTACGEIGAEDSVPFLIDMVEDPEPVVQEAAVRALGKIGGDEAKEMLDALVESPRKRIRTAAQAALEEIKFCDDPLSWTP